MEKATGTNEAKAGNTNTTTKAQGAASKKGEEKMRKEFTNFQVQEIKAKFLAPITDKNPDGGWTIGEADQLLINAVEHVPLEDLINGHTSKVKIGREDVTIPTLSMAKNVVVLRHADKKNKNGQSATMSCHLWMREEWMAVLPEAGMMVRIQKPNQKKGEWVLLDSCPTKDLEWRQKNVMGNFLPDDTGFVIPSIGGLNFKTGEIENVPTEPIVVNSIELHHRWHTSQERTDVTTNKSSSAGMNYCLKHAQEARDAGNEKAAQMWEDKADHFRTA